MLRLLTLIICMIPLQAHAFGFGGGVTPASTNYVLFSGDYSNVVWLKNTTVSGNDVTFATTNKYFAQTIPSGLGQSKVTGGAYFSGTPGKKINLFIMDAVSVGYGIQIILSSTPTRYSVTTDMTSAVGNCFFYISNETYLGVPIGDAGHTVTISYPQMELRSGATAYIPTTTVPVSRPVKQTNNGWLGF